MEKLDDIVVRAIADHVLRFDRLQSLLGEWIIRAGQAETARREEIRQLKSRQTRLESESANVIKLVRNGLCSADDPQIATELALIVLQKKAISADIDMLERQADGRHKITPQVLVSDPKLR